MINRVATKMISVLLTIALMATYCVTVTANPTDTKEYITICYVGSDTPIYYQAINKSNELFVSADDIAKIINREITYYEDATCYCDHYANRPIWIDSDGSTYVQGKTFKLPIQQIDGVYYFSLEKMLYLAHAQWCTENNILYIQLSDDNVMDFIDAYIEEILDNNISQTALLMNGESELSNAFKSSFAAIFNDFDVRVFVPFWGAMALTVEDYQNAMLQLAKDELEFIDEYGQSNLENLLNNSSFSEIKSLWDSAQSVANLPKDILTATDYVNQTYHWIKDAKNGTKLFSEYNNLADFTPPEINALAKELQGVSDALTIVNAIVNVNEIATRSKEWNEDFLAQIDLLTDFDETGYNKAMVSYIKKASTGLLEEHADTFTATTDACVEETLKVLGEKLVDLTPAGTFTSIIKTGLSVAKLLDEDFATSFDALELSNMVEWLIRIEYVAFTEMCRNYVTIRTNFANGIITQDELAVLRNSIMLSLRTNLRNKVFIYYLNTVRNNDSSWTDSAEAQEIEQDILWNYAKILELSESKPIDKLLVIDSFGKMYTNEYGCVRTPIDANILSATKPSLATYPAQYLGKTFKELKQILGNDYSYKSLGNGIFEFEFESVPYTFEFFSGDFYMDTLDDDTVLDDIVVDRINVETEQTITLIPNQPYTNLETYNSITNKTSAFDFYEDGLYGTMLYVTVDDIMLVYVWTKLEPNSAYTPTKTADYVFMHKTDTNDETNENLLSFNGHYYKVFHDGGIGWHDAKVLCEQMGGHLATISNQEEDDFVYSMVSGFDTSFWLGATDEESEGNWKWVTNESWVYDNSSFDNRNGVQHYLVINHKNEQTWDDQSEKATSQDGFLCDTGGYICEWDEHDSVLSSGMAEYNGHYYQVFDVGLTWEEAEAYCQEIGGHLVTITSAEEQNKINELIESQVKNSYWIGAQKQNESYFWITDESFDYTNWAYDQPDNNQKSGGEDKVHLYRLPNPRIDSVMGEWNDLNNDGTCGDETFFGLDNFGFICEWDDLSASDKPPQQKPNIPSDALAHNGHHYRIYSNVCATWEEAKDYCENLGGHLAVISSQEENDALFSYLTESGYNTAYFGLYQDQQEEWIWVSDATNSYLNWHADEPSDDTNENYAEFYWKFSDGTWNDGNFDNGTQNDSKTFICEWE